MKRASAAFSIKHKLLIITMFISTFLVLLATTIYMILECISDKNNLISDLSTLANVIGNNCKASLLFDQADNAKEILNGFKSVPNIVTARLYDKDGKLFSEYYSETKNREIQKEIDTNSAPKKVYDYHTMTMEYVDLFHCIKIDNNIVGFIFLRSNLYRFYDQIKMYGLTTLLVLLISFLLSFLLAMFMQKKITNPIIHLADTMNSVSVEKNYSIRAAKISHDEIGNLIDRFNEMLVQIQDRDHKLEQNRNELENLVTLRTSQLKDKNDELEHTIIDLKDAKDKAEAASIAKSQFLANMSHEIRTPLNGVIGTIELMLKSNLDEIQLRYAESISYSGKALLEIINDILDFSRIEAGKLELEYLEYRLHDLIEETVAFFAESAFRKSIELSYIIHPNTPTSLIGDSSKIRQILVNLIGNSIKFTIHGEIHLFVSLHKIEGDKTDILFEVSDTGIGIEEEKLESIFSAFTQADGSMSRTFGGTGLGLAITKELIHLMGGEIWVESKINEGTTFRFTIQNGINIYVPTISTIGFEDVFKNIHCLILCENCFCSKYLTKLLTLWHLETDTITYEDTHQETAQKLEATADKIIILIIDLNLENIDKISHYLSNINILPEFSSLHIVIFLPINLDVLTFPVFKSPNMTLITKPVWQSKLFDFLMNTANRLGNVAMNQHKPPSELSSEAMQVSADVLVVEDNETNRIVSREMLEILGCRVDIAENGFLALDCLEAKSYDVIFMDCQMPGMDGFQATKIIREKEQLKTKTDKEFQPVIIVAMTAHALKEDRERCLRVGMNDYISKPYNIEQLYTILEKWVTVKENLGSPTAPEI